MARAISNGNGLVGDPHALRALGVVVILATATVGRATDVCGPITDDTTWTFDDSPYVVTCNVVVFAGATLTIEPGVEIRFHPDTRLVAQDGTIEARGVPDAHITLTSDDPQERGIGVRIRCSFGAVGHFEYCDFSGLEQAIHATDHGSGEISVVGCQFHQNETAIDGSALYLGPTVNASRFEYNTYGVRSMESGAVLDSVFQSNTYAIDGFSMSQMSGCELRDNDYGVTATYEPNVLTSVFDGNLVAIEAYEGLIDGSTFVNNDIGVAFDPWGGTGPKVRNSTISGNNIGVESFYELTGNVITENGTGVVIQNYAFGPFQCNDIFANTEYNAVVQTDVSLLVGPNWWGSIDMNEIDATIYDGFDDPKLGYLVYWPALTTPAAESHTCGCSGSWTQVADSGPVGRCEQAMAYDSARGKVVLFGGWDEDYMCRGDTWEWDGTTWTQVADSGPSPRSGHAMVYDSNRGAVVLFGGYDCDNGHQGDTWEWNGQTWSFVTGSGPDPRSGHAMSYDSQRGRIVLFGGYDADYVFRGDTWEWVGTTWTQLADSGPSARYGHAMAYDNVRNVVTLFGGHDENYTYCGDTWEWDGATWIQVADSGPSARDLHAVAYDSTRAALVLFGGYFDNWLYHGDTWEWDGTTWTHVADVGPTERWGHAMVYDTANGAVVLFGGHDASGEERGDTWEWSGPWPPPEITEHPADLTVDVGQSATFSSTAESPWPLTYQWRKHAVWLSDDDRISGAQTPTLTIDPVMPGDADYYDVLVSLACGGVTSQAATLTVGQLPGDVDGDGDVDLNDLSILLAHYGMTSGATWGDGDFDGDGDVDLNDLTILLANYGTGT
jgi:hypothetical protein